MSSASTIPADVAAPPGKVLIIQVAFDNYMWWSVPSDTSSALYQRHLEGENVGYAWDWGEYVFDFDEKVVTNVHNHRRHTIRLVWIDQVDEHARWTGKKPPQ